MPIETFNYLDSLNPSNPVASEGLVGGDDHIRGIKSTLLASFPNVTGTVTATHDALNTAASVAANIVARSSTVPPGAIMDFGQATAPTGWLACDGQAVSRTTYADLFAAIGTTWGSGDGSTTFNVPSLQDRYRRHRRAGGGALAGAVGTLQNPANLAHTHAGSGTTSLVSNDHTHLFSGTTGPMNSNASHGHTNNPSYIRPGRGDGADFNAFTPTNTGHGLGNLPNTADTNIDHTHNFSGTTSGITANHSHTYSFTTTTGSADDASEARPFSATVLTCIKT